MAFDTLEKLLVASAESVRPPERLTVSQAAERYRKLNNVGAYVGPWQNDYTPYLVAPMDTLTSYEFTGMIFVGPAQSGKTDMFLNWLGYTAKCDPVDIMLINTTQSSAGDFSKRRVDRLHRHSPEIGDLIMKKRNKDNTFNKLYRSGMLLNMSWPAISELSGRPIPRLWLTDYDRMSQDVDGEGSPYDLARKRATTFRSFGMTVAESSPGFVVEESQWSPSTPHEAPPTAGILALYNRGDRRRWYWRCVSCKLAFEPDFSLLAWPNTPDMMEAAEQAYMACPHCGQVYTHDPDQKTGVPGKHGLNRSGVWLADGQTIDAEGTIRGRAPRSDIASFWLKGPAAAMATWRTLVFNWLSAEREYQNTHTEEALKTTVTTDQGLPYVPKSQQSLRLADDLKARAREQGHKKVPLGVRFLVATVDVQKNRFVVQVHGIGVGGDLWLIDRFDVKKSERLDDDGDRAWVNPGAYPEDWKLLQRDVLDATYELGDGSGRHMSIKLIGCDSGGRAGVTTNAYNFWRWLRAGPDDQEVPVEGVVWKPNQHGRFLLLKGSSSPQAPRIYLDYPDSKRKDRHAGARGEIPVLMLNTNMAKDRVDQMLDRDLPGGGEVHFAKWMPDTIYAELCVEIKTAKGWENPKGYRNETWDLMSYCVALLWSQFLRLDTIDWDEPPDWAEEWDGNSLVFDPTDGKPFENSEKPAYDLRRLAEVLG